MSSKSIVLAICLMFSTALCAQNYKQLQLYSPDFDFKSAHVSVENVADMNDGKYLMQGKILSLETLKKFSHPFFKDFDSYHYFAVGCTLLKSGEGACLIRTEMIGGRERQIDLLIFEGKSDRFSTIMLAGQDGYEGAWSKQESWLIDMDDNPNLNILTRNISESYVQTVDSSYFKKVDELAFKVWGSGHFLKRWKVPSY